MSRADRGGEAAGASTPEERARRRLALERAFYGHLASYVLVIGVLFLMDAVTGPGWWFFWPALGWGIGVLIHALATFGVGRFVGGDWERRRLQELIDEERDRR